MIKLFISDFKKVERFGDAEYISENEWYHEFVGRSILVEILGLFWITYRKADKK